MIILRAKLREKMANDRTYSRVTLVAIVNNHVSTDMEPNMVYHVNIISQTPVGRSLVSYCSISYEITSHSTKSFQKARNIIA